ncbi:hypothetical protein, partial [Kaistella sp.]|uniref:hypothetical protein n=1 Tax=Kaistella sp. TaxID=2782235 RepID=UPI002F948F8D
GMSIGFGEVYIAFTFLISAIIIINSAEYVTRYFLPQHHSKLLRLQLSAENFSHKEGILREIKNITKDVSAISLEKKNNSILITLDIHIKNKDIQKLETYLLSNSDLEYFSY